ncbi:MAG: DUF1565 domain-containing protein, partial [Thermoguttaceae bacterium]|nr:DUF1565 domain-containing protein [Thermoguttaceae bacterium]
MLKSFENFMSLVDRKNLRTNAPKTRNCRVEFLEERALLSAVPLSAAEYSDLRAQYADFNLPENMADMNVITLDLAEGDDLAALKSAITTAGTTTQSDLIVVRTSTDASALTYTASTDELTININATQYGSISIIGLGDSSFTLDAAQLCRVMTVTGSSKMNLGGLTIQNGKADTGGGIYVNSGVLQVTNSTIAGNTASSYYGGGIYVNSGTTTVTNSTISGNTVKYYGGGIYVNSGTLAVTNSVISGNTASYYGGGIYNRGTVTTIGSVISG